MNNTQNMRVTGMNKLLNIRMAMIRYPMHKQLIAFVLYYGCDHSYEDVGNILGMSRQGAYNAIEAFKREAEFEAEKDTLEV